MVLTKQVHHALELTKREKLESKILTKIKFTPTRVIDLDQLLCDTYDRTCPEPIDYFNRRELIRIFNVITKEIYGNGDNSPIVVGYGSFVMGTFTNESDLDLSINFHDSVEVSRKEKICTLQTFKTKLESLEREGIVTHIQSIMGSKVPIVKVTDIGTGIQCDLSVNNWDDITRSQIIQAISAIDERFRKLCFLIKSWAKAHDINNSKDGTLNSLSITLFVAFHLQTCNPPILPPFSVLLRDRANLVSGTKIVETYSNYGKRNKESLAMLFVTLLVKLASVESLWQEGFCASVYRGSWIYKSWDSPDSMNVEDFMNRSKNIAVAVRTTKVETIYRCIHKTINYLSWFLNDQIQGTQLLDFLFGARSTSDNSAKNLPSLPPKDTPLMKGVEENLAKRHSEGNFFAQGLQAEELQGMGLMQQPLGKVSHNELAPRTPSISYQLPLPVPSSNIEVHHGPRAVPSPLTIQPKPIASSSSPIPSIQSGRVSSRSSRGGGVRSTSDNSAKNLPSLPPKDTPLMKGVVENLAKRHTEGNFSAQGLQGEELQGMGLMQQPLGKVSHNALASRTPSISYQLPLPVPSSNIEVHHGPRAVPSPLTIQPKPIASSSSPIPSIQSGRVSSRSSRGGRVRSTSDNSAKHLPSLPPKDTPLMKGVVENLAKRHTEGNFSAQGLQGEELQGMGLMQQPLGKVSRNALASRTPSISYQLPLPVPSSNIEVHHGPRAVPSPFTMQPKPIASSSSPIPSIQSGRVSSGSSRGGVQSLHQEAVAQNHGSFPPSSGKQLPPKKRAHHRM